MNAGRPLRIAFLSPRFSPEANGHSERFVRELSDELIRRGHRPRLITSHSGRPSRSVENGLPIVRNWRPPDGRLRRRQLEHHLTHAPFSYLALSAGDDELAHAVYPTDALAAARWSARTGRPSVLSYMGVPDHPRLMARRWRLEITLRALEGVTAVTAVSRSAADAFGRWLGLEPRVIHPGVDIETFTPGDERTEDPTIFCARPIGEPGSRIELLIAAHRLLRRERPQARLLLVRPPDAELARRAESSDERIELLDLDSPETLAETHRRAWVSVLPSAGEAFAPVVAEALACGTPVAGSDNGVIPEVIDRETVGGLFEGDEPEALKVALLEALTLAEDPGTRQACRLRAEDFSTARCADEHERLYRELIAGGH